MLNKIIGIIFIVLSISTCSILDVPTQYTMHSSDNNFTFKAVTKYQRINIFGVNNTDKFIQTIHVNINGENVTLNTFTYPRSEVYLTSFNQYNSITHNIKFDSCEYLK